MGSAKQLSAVAVAKLTKPGRYAVGNGAYLQISQWGTKAWVFRYTRDGRARHLGLGSAVRPCPLLLSERFANANALYTRSAFTTPSTTRRTYSAKGG
jgi:hypothetical protein